MTGKVNIEHFPESDSCNKCCTNPTLLIYIPLDYQHIIPIFTINFLS